MELAALIIIAIYFVLHIFFYIGLKRSENLGQNHSDRFPFISIIVAARNEEKNIGNCIRSLKKINYPKDRYEVILINDNSTDLTKSIMLKETQDSDEFILLDTIDYINPNLIGKVNALAYGISKSRGELYMMTDADCEIPENWVLETSRYLYDNVGLICGFTKVDFRGSLFSKLQSIDWIYLQSIASSSSGINFELSCIGNNLTVSSDAYKTIGGYDNLKFSVTEDLALMRRIKKENKFKILFPVNPNCLVKTEACKNFSELYRQKKRWFKGGIGINWLGYILGIELYASNILILFGFLFLGLEVYLLTVLFKIISELLIIIPVYRKFNYKGLLRYFPLFQIYFALIGLLLPFTFITGSKIEWKGRKH